jgi:hypothetical protein
VGVTRHYYLQEGGTKCSCFEGSQAVPIRFPGGGTFEGGEGVGK